MKIQPPLFVAACCVVAVGITTSLRSAGIEMPTLRNGIHLLSLTSSTPRSGVLVARDPQAVINVRTGPSTQSAVADISYPNEPVVILAENRSPDGYAWYQVRLSSTGREGWVRGDLVRVQPGTASGVPPIAANPTPEPEVLDNPGNPYGFPEYNSSTRAATPSLPPRAIAPPAANPSASPVVPPATNLPPRPTNQAGAIATGSPAAPSRELVFGANQPNQPSVTPQPTITSGTGGDAPVQQGVGNVFQRVNAAAADMVGAVTDRVGAFLNPERSQPTRFTQAQIDYFMEIALGSEWGNSNQLIRKWNQNLRIKVTGTRTSEDITALNAVMEELNGLIAGSGVQLTIDNNNPNVEIIYAPETEFSRIEPGYVRGNLGFFRTFWDRGVISRARILITNSSRVSQRERSHLIREELTQVMGLVRDSWRYQDSIFYQGWTDVNQYTADDRAIIQLLYSTNIQAGMSRSQVASVLQIVLNQQAASN